LIVEETKQYKEEERRKLVEEVKTQLWLSGPLISVTLLNFGISLVSLMFVGHLNELSLSGYFFCYCYWFQFIGKYFSSFPIYFATKM